VGAGGGGGRVGRRLRARTAFLAIAGLLILNWNVFPVAMGALSGLPLAVRIVAAAVLIAPLGFFMGMPFPRGVLRVGPLVDWGFAVNGVGSVLGATLVVLCAFTLGFRLALLGAALLYLAAFALLAAERWWHVRTVPGPQPVLDAAPSGPETP